MMKKPILYSKRNTNAPALIKTPNSIEHNNSQSHLKLKQSQKSNSNINNSTNQTPQLKSLDCTNIDDKGYIIAKRISQQSKDNYNVICYFS